MLFRRDREQDPRVVKDPHRLPPGQVLTLKWPVLSYGSPPRYDMTKWRLRLYGEVDAPATRHVDAREVDKSTARHVYRITTYALRRTSVSVWMAEESTTDA